MYEGKAGLGEASTDGYEFIACAIGLAQRGWSAEWKDVRGVRRVSCVSGIEWDLVDAALERPLVRGCNEVFADGILLEVVPFLGVGFVASQTVVPTARLEAPTRVLMFFSEGAFPVGDPFFDRGDWRAGEAEAVKVIRHEDVIGNEPGCCSAPGLFEVLLDGVVGEPGFAIFGGDGEEDAGGW
jgi:hypothetical protein